MLEVLGLRQGCIPPLPLLKALVVHGQPALPLPTSQREQARDTRPEAQLREADPSPTWLGTDTSTPGTLGKCTREPWPPLQTPRELAASQPWGKCKRMHFEELRDGRAPTFEPWHV